VSHPAGSAPFQPGSAALICPHPPAFCAVPPHCARELLRADGLRPEPPTSRGRARPTDLPRKAKGGTEQLKRRCFHARVAESVSQAWECEAVFSTLRQRPGYRWRAGARLLHESKRRGVLEAMSTTAAPNLSQVPVRDEYLPDDEYLRNSPPLEQHHPMLEPAPSPDPTLSSSVSPPTSPGDKSNRRRKARPNRGYAVLISHLDGHRREPAAYADIETLTSETEEPEEPALRETSVSLRDAFSDRHSVGRDTDREEPRHRSGGEFGTQRMTSGPPAEEDMGPFDLKTLAAGALAAFTTPQPEPDAGPTPPVTETDVVGGKAHQAPASAMVIHTRPPELPKDERERNAAHVMPSPYSPPSLYSPREQGSTSLSINRDLKSPTSSIHSNSHSEGLPPIQLNSPRYEPSGQTLPSIRAQLGDIQQLANNHAAGNGLRGSHHVFPGSPPAPMPRLPSLHSHLGSPPMPPTEPYREPHSPVHSLATPTLSPGFFYPQANGLHRPHDYAHNSAETPGSHQSCSPSATSGLERMSIDGMTIQTGSYVCKVPGCAAPPFQTQYLLNSHANVHSSARPHYCPVPGCARGEGGKGFKRKNEMIRHGLVHESPGYVCPFCPDRDHRYPRPDNLQR
jgi:hypothetical protein